MKVLFIDTVHPLLKHSLQAHKIKCSDGSQWDLNEINSKIHLYEGLVIRSRIKIDKVLIDKARKLKFIARAGAGMENIDSEYAKSKNIFCLNAPEGNRNAVAEHALGMLLASFNNLVKSNVQVKGGKWNREENRGLEVDGKTIGIIGFGNTGSSFANKLRGFECEIMVFDPYINPDKDLYPKINFTSIEELQAKCDIISLHVPLSEETNGMVNSEFINRFVKPVFLINTSRGKVVNTKDLIVAIKENKIFGAALDVLDFESLSFEHLSFKELPETFRELIKLDNVLLSPHIAGWTVESHHKISEVLTKKILDLNL